MPLAPDASSSSLTLVTPSSFLDDAALNLSSNSNNGTTNGMSMTNGSSTANGSSSNGNAVASSSKVKQYHNNGSTGKSPSTAIARVDIPGRRLYDDSTVDREEFVRLVIQSLRDVGYIESAATLEAESGYSMESPEVAEFRHYILEAAWDRAEYALLNLGVTDEDSLWDARFLITQQKYLELLEAQKTTAALHVLRNELAPMNVDPDHLHTLSSLIMCSTPEDVRRRADWDGASGLSRHHLLANLQAYIPPTTMIPPRRFATLLSQAQSYQILRCTYHNTTWSPSTFSGGVGGGGSSNGFNPTGGGGGIRRGGFSLYEDHICDKESFPRTTTTILHAHDDEVWNIEWSHDGSMLASASKDKTAIIWRVGVNCTPVHILRDHVYPVGCLAWSMDDLTLLTSSDSSIKLWNTKTGICFRQIDAHNDTITALVWMPDNSGFLSGSLDRRIIHWDQEGNQKSSWGSTAIRITDLAITPDFTQLVAVGMQHLPYLANYGEGSGPATAGASTTSINSGGGGSTNSGTGMVFRSAADAQHDHARQLQLQQMARFNAAAALHGREGTPVYGGSASASASASGVGVGGGNGGERGGSSTTLGMGEYSDRRMIVYDLTTRVPELSIQIDGELTSVKISKDSQYALVNHSPNEVQLWDLNLGRLDRKYTGLRQGEHVIRSCFGGADGTFIVSGSEDGNVYIWHRDTGTLLEVLSGHGNGSVNSVAWNPTNPLMFASCSDDNTIRIWEAMPTFLDHGGGGAVGNSVGMGTNGVGAGVNGVGGEGDLFGPGRKGKGRTGVAMMGTTASASAVAPAASSQSSRLYLGEGAEF